MLFQVSALHKNNTRSQFCSKYAYALD